MTDKTVILTVENTHGFVAGKKITIGNEWFLIKEIINGKRMKVRCLGLRPWKEQEDACCEEGEVLVHGQEEIQDEESCPCCVPWIPCKEEA